MTNAEACGIVQSETKNKSLQKGRRTMKTISSAIFYMSEWQANLIVLAALLHVRIDDILITDDAVA